MANNKKNSNLHDLHLMFPKIVIDLEIVQYILHPFGHLDMEEMKSHASGENTPGFNLLMW